MAIEDQRYEEAVRAVNAFIATGRHTFVRLMLVKLAKEILRYYGYDVIEASLEDAAAKEFGQSDAGKPSSD